MIISKKIGGGERAIKYIPAKCRSCGKSLKKPQAAKHEICPKCQRDRRY